MKRILIVEDEAVTAKDIESTLSLLGYEVAGLADNGEEAVAKALELNPDLVLMDIKLRGRMTGIDAAARILEKNPVPVVYLTAFADPETLRSAKLTYPFGYLVKPFEDSQLRAVIETTLARAEMSGALKKSRELLFSAMKSIVDGVIATSDDGRVTFMNSAAEAMTGWTEKEALGLPVDTVFNLTDEISGGKITGLLERAMGKGFAGAVSSHAVLNPRFGAGMPIEDSTALIRGKDGQPAGLILVFKDVTEKRKVQRSRQKYVDLYENASDLFFTCDPDGSITSVNAAAVSAFGYSGKAELYAAGLKSVFSADGYETLMRAQARFRANPSDQEAMETMRLEGRRKGGGSFPIELRLTPMTRDGALVGAHGVGRDVTEKERAEKRLKESEERYRSLYDKTPIMLCRMDTEERLLDMNEFWLLSMGYPKDGAQGRSLSEFIPGASPGVIRGLAAPGKDIAGVPVTLRKSDGGALECYLYCTPELDEAGRTVGWMAAFADITERRAAERALSTSEMLLDNIINSLEETVLVISPDLKMLSVNRAGEAMFGRPASALAGRPVESLHGQVTGGIYRAYVEESFGKLQPVSFEFPMKRTDGTEFPTEQTLSPLRSETGRVTAVVATVRDVTARKRAEEELRQKEDQLRHTQKMELVGQLISGVAHELNNPLASIVGYSQLIMKKRGIEKETKEDLKLMAQSATQCRRIVENLLRFVRKDEGEGAMASPAAMAGRVLELMKYRMKKTGITKVEIDIPKKLRVYCREQQMEQVLGNLVANAVDAMAVTPPEQRRLSLSCVRDGRVVRFRVENTGPEIPPGIIEKIFDPFFTTKKAREGTGLGLSLCRQIVGDHAGRIWAETPPVGGAAFVIELPSAESRPAGPKTSRRRAKPVSGLDILVVDDENNLASILHRTLTGKRNRVVTVSSLAAAKAAAASRRFDLIISDIVLGDGSGLDLRAHLGPSAPQFLFMTGNVMDAGLMRHFEENGLSYLKKPFDLEDLFFEVSRLLERRPV